jgi:hypothetical protein
MTFEPLLELPNLVASVWRRFGVHVFEGKVTVEDMARMEAVGVQWLKKNPGKMVEMTIIYPTDTRMTGEERARMARLIKRWEDSRTASATVILATGVLGSMHRSVLTGLQFLVRPPHPTKVFGVTAEAVEWLTPHVQELCGVDARYGDLVAGVDALCARFKANRGAGG